MSKQLVIRAAGGEATFVQADVSNPEEILSLVDETLETYGRLDVASPLIGAGVDLEEHGGDPGTQDGFGNPVARDARLSIGAHQPAP